MESNADKVWRNVAKACQNLQAGLIMAIGATSSSPNQAATMAEKFGLVKEEIQLARWVAILKRDCQTLFGKDFLTILKEIWNEISTKEEIHVKRTSWIDMLHLNRDITIKIDGESVLGKCWITGRDITVRHESVSFEQITLKRGAQILVLTDNSKKIRFLSGNSPYPDTVLDLTGCITEKDIDFLGSITNCSITDGVLLICIIEKKIQVLQKPSSPNQCPICNGKIYQLNPGFDHQMLLKDPFLLSCELVKKGPVIPYKDLSGLSPFTSADIPPPNDKAMSYFLLTGNFQKI